MFCAQPWPNAINATKLKTLKLIATLRTKRPRAGLCVRSRSGQLIAENILNWLNSITLLCPYWPSACKWDSADNQSCVHTCRGYLTQISTHLLLYTELCDVNVSVWCSLSLCCLYGVCMHAGLPSRPLEKYRGVQQGASLPFYTLTGSNKTWKTLRWSGAKKKM